MLEIVSKLLIRNNNVHEKINYTYVFHFSKMYYIVSSLENNTSNSRDYNILLYIEKELSNSHTVKIKLVHINRNTLLTHYK